MSIMHLVAQLQLHIEHSNRILLGSTYSLFCFHMNTGYQVILFLSEVQMIYLKKLIVDSTLDDKRHTFGIDFYIHLDALCKRALYLLGI